LSQIQRTTSLFNIHLEAFQTLLEQRSGGWKGVSFSLFFFVTQRLAPFHPSSFFIPNLLAEYIDLFHWMNYTGGPASFPFQRTDLPDPDHRRILFEPSAVRLASLELLNWILWKEQFPVLVTHLPQLVLWSRGNSS
jgi:hypothetical protein